MLAHLAAFDFFKSEFSLRFHKHQSISTTLGLLFSLIILVILAFYASQSDLFHRVAPRVLDSTMGLDNRPEINYQKKLLAVGIEDLSAFGYMDPSIYYINVINYYYDSTGDGYGNKQVQKTLHICSEDDFADDPSIYTTLSLSNMYCLEDSNFELKGYWDEPEMIYASIEMMLCNNELSNANVSCKSYEEMGNQINGYTFNVYYYDTIFDSSNQLTPLKKVIVNEWTYIDIRIRKETEILIENLNSQTDDGLLFENWNYINDQQYVSKNSDFNFADENDTSLPRVTFSFVAAKTERNIQRIYLKISDLLANIGGISHTLMIIGVVLVKMQRDFLIKKTILNSLYSFKIKKNGKNKKSPLSNPNKFLSELRIETKLLECKTQKTFKTIETDLNIINQVKSNLSANTKPTRKTQEDPLEKVSSKKCDFTQIQKKILREDIDEMQKVDSEIDCNNIELREKIIPIKKVTSFSDKIKNTRRKGKLGLLSLRYENQMKHKAQAIMKFQEYKQKLLNNRNLTLNECEYSFWKMKRALVFWKNKETDEVGAKIFEKSKEIFEKNIDIIEIVKKLQEIEKLKTIIFDENQLKLFNFISKPLVYLNDDQVNKKFTKTRTVKIDLNLKQENDRDMVTNLLHHFEQLKNEEKLTEVDKKLLDCLDRDLEGFLEE